MVQLLFLIFEKALNTWDIYKPEEAYKNFYLGVDETPWGQNISNSVCGVCFGDRKAGPGADQASHL